MQANKFHKSISYSGKSASLIIDWDSFFKSVRLEKDIENLFRMNRIPIHPKLFYEALVHCKEKKNDNMYYELCQELMQQYPDIYDKITNEAQKIMDLSLMMMNLNIILKKRMLKVIENECIN